MALQALKSQLHVRHKDIKENLAKVFSDKEGKLAWDKKLRIALSVCYTSGARELAHFLEELCHHDLKLDDCSDIKALIPMLELKNCYNESISLLEDINIFPADSGIIKTNLENPGIDKTTFDLIYLAVSLINQSRDCVIKAKESFLKNGGTTEEIFEVVKIVSVIKGCAKAFDIENKGPVIN